MHTSLANMSCLCCSAAFLAWVGLAVISFTMQLSVELNQQSDTRVSPRAPRNSRHGLRPRIITERISSDRSRTPARIRTRPVDTSSTWYIPALSPPRAAHRDATDSTSGRRPETMLDRLPPPRPLAPLPPRSGREPGQASPTHLIRIRMVQFVHIQVLHRSVHLPRWFMDLVNFYKNSLLPFAMHILNRSRHGHRVN